MIGLCLSMLGEVADHGVSSGPACNTFHNLLALPSIEVCVQLHSLLPGFVAEGLVGWLIFLEDDSLYSLEGVTSLGLGWRHFHRMDWTFSSLLDSASVSSCMPKTWLTPEMVFQIGERS